jgi:ACS family allantoate permease-like MFS transporter
VAHDYILFVISCYLYHIFHMPYVSNFCSLDITYLCFEFPSNIILQRYKMGRMLSCYMICWGIVVLCIGFAQNFTQLITLRALQGVFECCISPGFILVIGSWYTTREHTSRSLVFQSANAGFGVLASLIMYGLGVAAQRNKNDEAWRYISYVSLFQQLRVSVILISYSSSEA